MATIFCIDFSELSEEGFFEFVGDRIKSRDPCYIVTPNLNFARLVHADRSFRAVIDSAALRLCDSAILSGMLSMKGRTLPARLPGSDLTPKLLAMAEERGLRVFLFGSDERTLESVKQKFPRAVCGMACPPLHDHPCDLDELNDKYLAAIQRAKPDIMFVALGARKQEYWAQKYFVRAGVPVVMCIGASLDFVAQKVRRCPKLLGKIGLEWLWRLVVEPSRLGRRYAEDAFFILRHGWLELLRR